MGSCQKLTVVCSSSHLVPALERVLPSLHQVSLTDPRDAEVQRGAGGHGHGGLLHIIHHLPVTGLTQNHIDHNIRRDQ